MPGMGDRAAADPAGSRAGSWRRRWSGTGGGPRGGRRGAWRRARIRRCLSALLVALAAWVVTGAVLPDPPSRGVPVVVAARDLPAGQRLGADDVRVVRWPRDLRAGAAFGRVDQAVGESLAAPLVAGEPVTRARVGSSALLTGLPRGRVVAYVRDTGGLAHVLRPGDHVAAVSTADGSTIAPDLLVLSVGAEAGGEDPAGVGFGPVTSDDAGGTGGVLVAATPHTASRLAESRGSDTPGAGVMLTLHRPE